MNKGHVTHDISILQVHFADGLGEPEQAVSFGILVCDEVSSLAFNGKANDSFTLRQVLLGSSNLSVSKHSPCFSLPLNALSHPALT